MTQGTGVGYNIIPNYGEIENLSMLRQCKYYIPSSRHSVLVTYEGLATSFSPRAKLGLTTFR